MSKVYIRFLRQGLVKTNAPGGFDKMTAKEKMEWASEKLCRMPDIDIIASMADFENSEKTGEYFDKAPYASAIEEAEGENIGRIITETKEWGLFASGEGLNIVSRDLLNFMEDNPDALIDMTPAEEDGRRVINANDAKGNALEIFCFESEEEADKALEPVTKEKQDVASSGDICQLCKKLGENTCPDQAPDCFEKSA